MSVNCPYLQMMRFYIQESHHIPSPNFRIYIKNSETQLDKKSTYKNSNIFYTSNGISKKEMKPIMFTKSLNI